MPVLVDIVLPAICEPFVQTSDKRVEKLDIQQVTLDSDSTDPQSGDEREPSGFRKSDDEPAAARSNTTAKNTVISKILDTISKTVLKTPISAQTKGNKVKVLLH